MFKNKISVVKMFFNERKKYFNNGSQFRHEAQR